MPSFGVNLVEIPPGNRSREHDETARDQEELFFVVSGSPVFVIDGEDHPRPTGDVCAARPCAVGPSATTARSRASVLIVSAPTTSGFQPMEWA